MFKGELSTFAAVDPLDRGAWRNSFHQKVGVCQECFSVPWFWLGARVSESKNLRGLSVRTSSRGGSVLLDRLPTGKIPAIIDSSPTANPLREFCKAEGLLRVASLLTEVWRGDSNSVSKLLILADLRA